MQTGDVKGRDAIVGFHGEAPFDEVKRSKGGIRSEGEKRRKGQWDIRNAEKTSSRIRVNRRKKIEARHQRRLNNDCHTRTTVDCTSGRESHALWNVARKELSDDWREKGK